MICIDMETIPVFRYGGYVVEWAKIYAYMDENESLIMHIPLIIIINLKPINLNYKSKQFH